MLGPYAHLRITGGQRATLPSFPGPSKISNSFLRNLVLPYNDDNSDASIDAMLLSINAGWGQSWTLGLSLQPWRRCVVRKPLWPKKRWIIGLLKRANGSVSGKLLLLQN